MSDFITGVSHHRCAELEPNTTASDSGRHRRERYDAASLGDGNKHAKAETSPEAGRGAGPRPGGVDREAVARLIAARVEQGLPTTVTDRTVLANLAVICRTRGGDDR